MHVRCISAAAVLGFVALIAPALSQAQLGNLAYQASDIGVPLVSFNEELFTGGPGGSNTVLMLRKYMIVMGSHGRTAVKGVLLGSVSSKVIRNSSPP